MCWSAWPQFVSKAGLLAPYLIPMPLCRLPARGLGSIHMLQDFAGHGMCLQMQSPKPTWDSLLIRITHKQRLAETPWTHHKV
jgi:hypothetical protein